MARGSSPKRERQHGEDKDDSKREGRYPRRDEEAPAHIVEEQRAQPNEAGRVPQDDQRGSGLPIARYEDLTVPQISARLHGMSYTQLRALEQYERAHKNRSTLLRRLQRRIHH